MAHILARQRGARAEDIGRGAHREARQTGPDADLPEMTFLEEI